jgi:NAD(P)-dependent dehydrogenase (short-subunit alcohol dehydrogenase family)
MDETTQMAGKTCLITGATLGIGLETAVALARMGAHVDMVARDPARGEAALADVRARSAGGDVELLHADLASLDEVRRLASDFRSRHTELHVLINNAGAYNAHRTTTSDGFETTFGVNHLAHFLLTNMLLDLLRASAPSRIVNVSSAAHVGGRMNFDDLNAEHRYSGMRAYGQSKLANVLFTYELARRLEGSGVTANSLHPGVVATGFGKNNPGLWGRFFSIGQVVGKPFFLSSEEGARTTIYLASSPDVERVNGQYFVKSKAVPSSERSHDRDAAGRLWDMSEQMIGATTSASG